MLLTKVPALCEVPDPDVKFQTLVTANKQSCSLQEDIKFRNQIQKVSTHVIGKNM
jgi:hypothetical protein